MPFTNYFSKAILDQAFRGTAYTFPTTMYVGLGLNTGTPDGSGADGRTGFNEPGSGLGYARFTYANNTTNWPAATGTTNATKSNSVAITFGPNTTTNWGTVAYWGLFDGGTLGAGNLCIYGSLTLAKAVNIGDSPSFAIGALTITLT